MNIDTIFSYPVVIDPSLSTDGPIALSTSALPPDHPSVTRCLSLDEISLASKYTKINGPIAHSIHASPKAHAALLKAVMASGEGYHLWEQPPTETLSGYTLVTDPALPEDEVHVKDVTGATIRIIHLEYVIHLEYGT